MLMALVAWPMQSVLQTWDTPALAMTAKASPANKACVTATSTDAAPAASSSCAARANVRPLLAMGGGKRSRDDRIARSGVLAALDWAALHHPAIEWVVSVAGDCPLDRKSVV